MKVKSLMVFTLVVVMLLPVLAISQTWNEEDKANAKSILQEKFQLEESLSFQQEGAMDTETLQVFPASVNITDEGLDDGITVALTKYGEETFLPVFIGSLPEFDPPYGFALMNEDGNAVYVGPAELEGAKQGLKAPVVELLEEGEETYKVALKFTAATIRLSIPKNAPSAG